MPKTGFCHPSFQKWPSAVTGQDPRVFLFAFAFDHNLWRYHDNDSIDRNFSFCTECLLPDLRLSIIVKNLSIDIGNMMISEFLGEALKCIHPTD